METEQIKKIIAVFFVMIFLVGVAGFLLYKINIATKENKMPQQKSNALDQKVQQQKNVSDSKIEKFNSAEEFKAYLSKSDEYYSSGSSLLSGSSKSFGDSSSAGFEAPTGTGLPSASMSFANPLSFNSASSSSRISQTNVQVAGIDEPDIVKTDGKKIYYSRQGSEMYFSNEPFSTSSTINTTPKNQVRNLQETSILTTLPVEKIEKSGKIEKYGEMLLYENILVIFSGKDIFGFDISDPKNPSEKWKLSIDERSSLVQARKLGKEIYIISNTSIDRSSPCPIQPITSGIEKIAISCEEIYHPTDKILVNSTYSIMTVDIESGSIKDKTSFVGSSSDSIVYMNGDYIYLTYEINGNIANIFIDFILAQKDLFSQEVTERVNKLSSYDISQEAKMMEITKIIEEQAESGSKDDQLKMENELGNRMKSYMSDHKRELSKTGIVKISTKGLDIEANGIVPGSLLNQFSLDEYEKNLRVATTVGAGEFGSSETAANDIYVLGEDLSERGSIKDMGINERIYSVRFIGDKGYLVTFKQTDPFFVLDLSNPDNPRKAGELKIPGYSSYLHPLEKNLILGIGKEDSKVKLSLFDVSSPDNPQEINKYVLSEYWSEALDNHHAFLADSDNKVFFLPGGQGGYVFSYSGDKLELKVASSEAGVQRALYIGGYLYIVGKNEVAIYNEKNWLKAGEFNF